MSIGFFGLIHSFPPSYLVALGILTIASAVLWRSKEDHSKLLFLQLSLFIISLWLIPLLIGGAQPAAEHVRVKFFDYGYVPGLAEAGHLTPTVIFQNWPSLYITMAGVIDIMGITNLEPSFILAPAILQFAFALVLVPFLKRFLGPGKVNYCWAGIWILVLANWGGNNYLGAQPYALLLLMLLLFVFIVTARQPQGSTVLGYRISMILLIATLVTTHLLTYLVSLAMVAALTILYRKRISFNLVIIAAVLGAAWTLYQTPAILNQYLPQFADRAFNIWVILGDLFGNVGETGGIVGSASHRAVASLRILFSGMFVVITIIGFMMGLRSRENRTIDYAFIAIGLGAILGGVSGLYPQEMVQRTWYFMLPVVAYFGVKLLNRRVTATLLILLLVAALPLHFIAHYGNQASDYRTPSHIAGYAWRDIVIEKSPRDEALFRHLDLKGDLLLFSNEDSTWSRFPTEDHYFPISQRMVDYYDFQRDQPDLVDKVWTWARNSDFYDSIYSNPEYNLYIHYGSRPEEGINIAPPESSS